MAEEVKGKNLRPPESLKDYCQWLAEFNPNIQGKELEIPGMSEWWSSVKKAFLINYGIMISMMF